MMALFVLDECLGKSYQRRIGTSIIYVFHDMPICRYAGIVQQAAKGKLYHV